MRACSVRPAGSGWCIKLGWSTAPCAACCCCGATCFVAFVPVTHSSQCFMCCRLRMCAACRSSSLRPPDAVHFVYRSRRLPPRAANVLSLGSARRLLSILWLLCRREGACARPAAHGARWSRFGWRVWGWAGVGLRLSSAWHVGVAYVVCAYVLPCEGVRVGPWCTCGLEVRRLPLPAPGTGQRPGLVAPAPCMLRLLGCLCLWQCPAVREPLIADVGWWRF